MQSVTLTLTITAAQATNILAALGSTAPQDLASHTSTSLGKSAPKSGKVSPKAAAPAIEEEATEDFTTEPEADLDEALGAAEEKDFTVAEVSKLMTEYAKKNKAAGANKMLAKYKVKKLSELNQSKLNQLAAEIS